jgi:hypothetical protein
MGSNKAVVIGLAAQTQTIRPIARQSPAPLTLGVSTGTP